MASCSRHQSVYIPDWKNNVVHRIAKSPSHGSETVTKWSVDDEPAGVSVNSAGHLLVACDRVGKVKEFTTVGKLVRQFSLRSVVEHPCHAVELPPSPDGRQILACVNANSKDRFHRVCGIDVSRGSIVNAYGGLPGAGPGQLDLAVRLAVDDTFVAVADVNNNRVLLLGPTLSNSRVLLSDLKSPCRLWYDMSSGRLYVAVNERNKDFWRSGYVCVYDLQKF
jgi:DNA-binding beta-propeller fold protein YncE